MYEIRNEDKTTNGIINREMIAIEAKIAAISRNGPMEVKDCMKLLLKSIIFAVSTGEITFKIKM